MVKAVRLDINGRDLTLKVGHTQKDYDAFIKSLDINYNAGFGGQELYGNIWFTDGSWAERGEYDGSEWWEIPSEPKIPYNLK